MDACCNVRCTCALSIPGKHDELIHSVLVGTVVGTNLSCAEILTSICSHPSSRELSEHLIDGIEISHPFVKCRCLRARTLLTEVLAVRKAHCNIT